MEGRERSGPRRGLAIAACLLSVLIVAPAADAAAKPKPKRPLVYIFSLDGLDRDAVADEEKAPFLSDLIADRDGAHGVYFPASSSVMVAETNPNHSSMITGAFPETHGIVGNAFATPGAGADEDSCPASPGGAPVVTTGESPDCLQAETAFAALERQGSERRYTTALIMGKDKLARLFSSQDVHPGTYDADYIWAPCDDPVPYCDPDVPTNPISGYAADDALVMDEVIRTTREGIEDGGGARRPNLTFVNFPAIDTAGHTFGRTSSAYADAVGAASEQIRRFVDNQKELGTWRRTVMIVVSDHSMDDTPQLAKVSLRAVLTAGGVSSSDYEIVGNGSAAHIYLTDRDAAGAPELLARMRAALTGSPSIDQALYRVPNPADGGERHTIASAEPSWFLGGVNAGDIVVSTLPGVAVLEASSVAALPVNPLQGNHGSTFTRDNFWMIAGGGKLVRRANSNRAVTNANAAPTALALLGAKPPADAQASVAKQAFRKKQLRRLSR